MQTSQIRQRQRRSQMTPERLALERSRDRNHYRQRLANMSSEQLALRTEQQRNYRRQRTQDMSEAQRATLRERRMYVRSIHLGLPMLLPPVLKITFSLLMKLLLAYKVMRNLRLLDLVELNPMLVSLLMLVRWILLSITANRVPTRPNKFHLTTPPLLTTSTIYGMLISLSLTPPQNQVPHKQNITTIQPDKEEYQPYRDHLIIVQGIM
ncbi:hypothetical protein FRX31_012738 [Thalictrum thalictroides]|uniref:Uncharacterized protein n=1 Tax=Thalictrum thalictroides TaxID=46969 RepID=A0A7J6WNI0_THATH|nr:hypothetical protein FRX31_012738 [Thalictrum thalictroides]